MNFRFRVSALGLLTAAVTAVAGAAAADYQQQALEDAHAAFHAATNSTMYAAAAAQYESLIRQEGIRSGHLFYTAGNSWFMAGDIGRAILNYRRAEQYLPADADLKHNLQAARELRKDLIPAKEPHPLEAWLLKIPLRLRWTVFAVLWGAFWAVSIWRLRSRRKEAKAAQAVLGVPAAVLLVSLIAEGIMQYRVQPGVITELEILARKGDGTMYAPAFRDPLHAGTEFRMLEQRGSWMQIELADGQSCWIPNSAGQIVALR